MSSSVKLNTNTTPSTSFYDLAFINIDLGIDNLDFTRAIQKIGFAIEVLLGVCMMFVSFTSLGGAFISGCPFRSAFSDVLRLIFENLPKLSKRITSGCFSSKGVRWVWIGTLTFLWVALNAAVAIATFWYGIWFSLLFFPAAFPIAFLAQQKVIHKPQKYKISRLAAWAFLFLSLSMVFASCLTYFSISILPTLLYYTGLLSFIPACWMFKNISKSMADTGEIDTVAWLLITEPPQHPAKLFKKAGQMTGFDSIGRYYRPRLLESLMPLLTLLITSYHAPSAQHHSSDTNSTSSKPRRNFKIELKGEQSDDVLEGRYGLRTSLSIVDDDTNPIDDDPHLKNLEIYIACLARLSEFTDYEGSFWCLWEDAMQHSKLEQPLIDKLVVLANPRHDFQDGLRSAATKVLNNYELDMEGKPLGCSASVLWSVSTVMRSVATSMLNFNGFNSQDSEQRHTNLRRPMDPSTRIQSTNLSGDSEIEEVKREPEIGGSGIC